MNNPLTIEQRIAIVADYNTDKIKEIKELLSIESASFIEWAVDNHTVSYEGFSLPVWIKGKDYNAAHLYELYQQTKTK